LEKKIKTGLFRKTTIRNIAAISAVSRKKKIDHYLAQFPGTNPIKNIWSAMKHKLQERRIFTIKQLSRHLREI